MIRRSITTTKIQKNYFSPPAKFFNIESKHALIFWGCCSFYKRAATAVTYCSFDLFIFRPANMLLYSCGVSSPAATSCDMRYSTEPVFSRIILPSSLNPADFFSSSADFFFFRISANSTYSALQDKSSLTNGLCHVCFGYDHAHLLSSLSARGLKLLKKMFCRISYYDLFLLKLNL